MVNDLKITEGEKEKVNQFVRDLQMPQGVDQGKYPRRGKRAMTDRIMALDLMVITRVYQTPSRVAVKGPIWKGAGRDVRTAEISRERQ